MKTCPRCGLDRLADQSVMNALSRKDNKTYVCSYCGTEEAFTSPDPWPTFPEVYAPLTDGEKEDFDRLRDLASADMLTEEGETVRAALMRARLGNRHVAVVVAVTDRGEDGFQMDPLAVLVDDQMFQDLDPMTDEMIEP